jgi:predicted nucleic acid-binding Zn ribbon protein
MATRALRRASASGERNKRAGDRHTAANKRRRSSSSGDPQEVGSVLEEFLSEQGWEATSAIARINASWPDIVGPEVSEHVQVESVVDTQLVLRADSTAWATQLRLLTSTILDRVQGVVGPSIVASVTVRGPDAPSWRAGPRVVRGRGPRDTYG